MAIKDVLLTLISYPDPTPISVIDRAVSLASFLGAHIAAISCEAHLQIPGTLLSGAGNLGAMVASEAQKSTRNAQDLLAAFEAAARKAGVLHETVLERSLTFEVPDLLVKYARMRDLTIVPVPEFNDPWYAEAVIFGSGWPTLVVPEAPKSSTVDLNRVLVAWDFSRAAARAATGDVLAAQIESRRSDLLVMGAYGHSRLREFILGGATRSVLTKPPIAVLLSH